MAKIFRCTIVTPTAALFDEQATYASFPAWDGQQGVMTGQSPLLTRLGIGSLRVDLASGGGAKWFLLDGGFAQVQNDVLTLLTEAAIPAESISLQEAQAQLAESNARIASESGEDRKKVEHDQQLALAKAALARTATSRN